MLGLVGLGLRLMYLLTGLSVTISMICVPMGMLCCFNIVSTCDYLMWSGLLLHGLVRNFRVEESLGMII